MIADLLVTARTFIAAKWDESFWSGCSVSDALGRAARLEGLPGEEAGRAYELLEAVALPAVGAMHAAAERYCAGDKSAWYEARDCARAAGDVFTLDGWLEKPGRRHAEVLRAFDVAILKARDSRG